MKNFGARKIIILALLLVLPGVMFHLCNVTVLKQYKLPYFGHYELQTKTIEGKTVVDTVYDAIPSFSFINQFNDIITEDSLEGKIYVAEFFFTSCASACPIMTSELQRVHDKFKNNDRFAILSHTVDPKNDTLQVLKDYSDKHGAQRGTWHFLTGDTDQIYDIATHYLIGAGPGETIPLHGSEFVLLDQQRKIRGIYDGMDTEQVDHLIEDLTVLLRKQEIESKKRDKEIEVWKNGKRIEG